MSDEPIPMLTDGIESVEPGMVLSVSYNSRRSDLPQHREGEIRDVVAVDEGVAIDFIAEDRSRCHMLIAATFGESTIESRKRPGRQWTTLGEPMRVDVYPGEWDHADRMNRAVVDALSNKFDYTVALAQVNYNAGVLKQTDQFEAHDV